MPSVQCHLKLLVLHQTCCTGDTLLTECTARLQPGKSTAAMDTETSAISARQLAKTGVYMIPQYGFIKTERERERESRCLCTVKCDLLSPTGTICLKHAISLSFPSQCSERVFWSSHTLRQLQACVCVCVCQLNACHLFNKLLVIMRETQEKSDRNEDAVLPQNPRVTGTLRGIKTHIYQLCTCVCL